jgi:hypothetical protein
MTPNSASATEAARRLWARYADDEASAEELAAAAKRLFSQLETGLARWVGAEGFRVLSGRALRQAQASHPALGDLPDSGRDVGAVVSAVRTNGAPKVAAGMITVIATLIELLGRIIGEEMAVRLVEQTGAPSPREELSIPRQRGGHG